MTDNEVYVEKFKLLVDEMDVIRHPVNSLFAKSNNDIGLLTSGSPNYNVIEFDFPIKDGANLTPLPIKQHFLHSNGISNMSTTMTQMIVANFPPACNCTSCRLGKSAFCKALWRCFYTLSFLLCIYTKLGDGGGGMVLYYLTRGRHG